MAEKDDYMIPYSHQSIDEDDIKTVIEALRSDWLTQGSRVETFEAALSEYCGVRYAVVMSSGTAALHAAFATADLGPGDEFITTPMTFVATVNVGLWQRAQPVFVDIDRETGNIDPGLIEEKITAKTKALVPVAYTGRPADLKVILTIAKQHNLVVIEDACQALGALYHGQPIGSVSDLTAFSFHPVKSITTGEGGAVLTNHEDDYNYMKRFVTHGITKGELVHESHGSWYFEMQNLGLNYRLTDIQCALGLSQLKKLDPLLARRRRLAQRYTEALKDLPALKLPLADTPESRSAWHLYVIQLQGEAIARRSDIFAKLREQGIGAQVHHIPVYWHPYYERLGYQRGLCPVAEAWYQSVISLPLYPDLTEAEQDQVIASIQALVGQ